MRLDRGSLRRDVDALSGVSPGVTLNERESTFRRQPLKRARSPTFTGEDESFDQLYFPPSTVGSVGKEVTGTGMIVLANRKSKLWLRVTGRSALRKAERTSGERTAMQSDRGARRRRRRRRRRKRPQMISRDVVVRFTWSVRQSSNAFHEGVSALIHGGSFVDTGIGLRFRRLHADATFPQQQGPIDSPLESEQLWD